MAKAKNKPITAIINTHWHLDHTTGNARIRAAYPGARLYASTAVEGALKGFLAKNIEQAKALLDDPAVPEERKADVRLYLAKYAATEGDVWTMDHAAFSNCRQAFDAFTACAESTASTASCVAIWRQQEAAFVAMHSDPKYVDTALTYYVDQVLRVPAKRSEYCGN